MSTPKNQQTAVNFWNRKYPIGTPVMVNMAGQDPIETHTRSAAWLAGEHTAVIGVDGIAGAIELSRVEADYTK